MGLHGIQYPHNVPDTLADKGTPQQEGGHGGALAGRPMLGTAAEAEASLLNGQCRKALGYGADGEIAIPTRDGLLVTGILGNTQRDVGALGVALQADA